MTNDFKTPTDEQMFTDLLFSLYRTANSMANGAALLKQYAYKLSLDQEHIITVLNRLESVERELGEIATAHAAAREELSDNSIKRLF